MKTPIVAGREFDEHDTLTTTKVALVNESFARHIANQTNVVGKRLWKEATASGPAADFEIVGVVRNTKYHNLQEDFVPIVFLPATQDSAVLRSYDFFVLRSIESPAGLIPSVTATLKAISPQITSQFTVLKNQIQNSLLRERLMATLSGFFGSLALVLACVGLYGILSYGVASRTNEIGLRMALGAQRRDVLWLILREALLLVLIGVAVGLPAVLAATRLVSSLLYGLTPTDPNSIGAAAALMLAVAAVAGYFPARRATKVDPMEALRHE